MLRKLGKEFKVYYIIHNIASGGVTSISSNSNYTGYSGDQYTNDKYKGYGSDSVNKVNINNIKPTSTTSTNEA